MTQELQSFVDIGMSCDSARLDPHAISKADIHVSLAMIRLRLMCACLDLAATLQLTFSGHRDDIISKFGPPNHPQRNGK